VPGHGWHANNLSVEVESDGEAMNQHRSTDYAGGRQRSAWLGWIAFAAVILVVNGVMTSLQGLAGIFRDDSYFAGDVLVFNYTAWGWIHLLVGLAMVAVGAMLLKGSIVARSIAVVLVAINLVEQFAWTGAYPFWAIVIIAIDMFIIYALVVHGGELRE